LLAEERYKTILELLGKNNSIKSSYLIKLFNVSVETVRRDLEHLEKEGFLHRVHGGAVLDEINPKSVDFTVREKTHNKEKVEIAKNAIQFISEGSVIALDNGTTTLEIAKILKKKFNKLTILTHSLLVVEELINEPNYTIILLGGIVNGKDKSLKGALVENYIDLFHIDIAFISISGVSIKEGATEFELDTIPIQKKLIKRSRQKILLADSSKFGVVSLLKVCDLNDVDCIITDSNLKDTIYEKYKERGISVIKTASIK
jgi:DeoR/GlpR family transcriptional regulator of sugar metabolism